MTWGQGIFDVPRYAGLHNAHPVETDVTGVILAGGRSTRMGRDKATLGFAGQTLFGRTLAMLRRIFPRVLIAGRALTNLHTPEDLRRMDKEAP